MIPRNQHLRQAQFEHPSSKYRMVSSITPPGANGKQILVLFAVFAGSHLFSRMILMSFEIALPMAKILLVNSHRMH